MAVIGIIALLLTIGAVGIKNVGEGQGPIAGAAVAEGLLDEARAIAVSRGTVARLLINADESLVDDDQMSERSRYLREMVVTYKKVDPETGVVTETWVIDSNATMLPEKVFYSSELSREEHSSGGEVDTASHTLKRNGDPMKCYYYEFNSEGICTTPGASFVVVGGVLPKGQDEPIMGDKKNMAGFVVWRNGRTSAFRGPGHIED